MNLNIYREEGAWISLFNERTRVLLGVYVRRGGIQIINSRNNAELENM